MYKFEIYERADGDFGVRFMYNAEVMFVTEGYTSKQNAERAIESFKVNGPQAIVEDNS